MSISAIPSNAGVVFALRTLYATWFVMEGSPTCAVLRFTVAGGNPKFGIPGTPTQVPGLTAVPCVASQPGQYLTLPTDNSGARPMLKTNEREFAFLDFALDAKDRLSFEGQAWEIAADDLGDKRGLIQNDANVGSSVATFRKVA